MQLSKHSRARAASAFSDLGGDPRRARRVASVVEQLAANPRVSFPEAMGSEAAIEGGYRLINSSHVTPELLNAAHAGVTAKRAAEAGLVYAIHDTTICEFDHADPAEIGYTVTGAAGFGVHYTLVVAANELRPLGIVHSEAVVHTKRPRHRYSSTPSTRRRPGSQTVRSKDRGSLRWNRGFDAACQRMGTENVVHLVDREGDNYNLLAQALVGNMRFVVRARVKARRVEDADGEKLSLAELIEGARGKLRREAEVSSRKASTAPGSARPARKPRIADLEFSAARIRMPRPRIQPTELPAEIELNVVRVWEPAPPKGEQPIEWLLYTTEPIATQAQVAAIVDMYRARWLIEECNKAIKTGCQYETREFQSRDALLTLLALTFPIACEILALRSACRRAPDAPATFVVTTTQLEILRRLGSRPLPRHPSTHEVLWAVAGLGGHMKTNGEPGWLVLYRGMSKLLSLEEGWRAAKQDSAGDPISR